MDARRRWARALAAVGLSVGVGLAWSASVGAAASSSKTIGQQRAAQTKQRKVKSQLSNLKKKLQQSQASHAKAADALAKAEAEVVQANRQLQELAQAREAVQVQVTQLVKKIQAVGAHQSEAWRQLRRISQAQFGAQRASWWQRLLQGQTPAQLARERLYWRYLAQARAREVAALSERQKTLGQLREQSEDKKAQLARIDEQLRARRADLVKKQAQRQQAVVQLARSLKTQRQRVAKLEQDEQRLSSLVNRLAQLAKAQRQREAEQREQARRQREAARLREQAAAKARAQADRARADEPSPAASAGVDFARLRGRLAPPVQGQLSARFGQRRALEGAGKAPTWKGIFIQAQEGSEVRAVAGGQVLFADWLRGFGNLIILDHGEGFLSVYGNNEKLLRQNGETVQAGQVIASVGNTGAHEQAGLYFEIRFNGQAIDPLKWVLLR